MPENTDSIYNKKIKIQTNARLHFGFLDMHGGLDRTFGSLGLAIDAISTILTASFAPEIDIKGEDSERAGAYARDILSYFEIKTGIQIQIETAIPNHAGLGSGTQLALAVATAITRLYGLSVPTTKLAKILKRGGRSGIGIGTFMYGGFIVDAGRCNATSTPPIISHMPVPSDWRFIIIKDPECTGINGIREADFFKCPPRMDEKIAAKICRHTLMQVLPAVMEDDCTKFGAGITQIQSIMGNYFAKTQGGYYTSSRLQRILERKTRLLNATGYGQSSWGPTGFVIFPSEQTAVEAEKEILRHWRHESKPHFLISRASNQGAKIETILS